MVAPRERFLATQLCSKDSYTEVAHAYGYLEEDCSLAFHDVHLAYLLWRSTSSYARHSWQWSSVKEAVHACRYGTWESDAFLTVDSCQQEFGLMEFNRPHSKHYVVISLGPWEICNIYSLIIDWQEHSPWGPKFADVIAPAEEDPYWEQRAFQSKWACRILHRSSA